MFPQQEFDNIISAIKNTEKGETIPKIIAKPNKIYLGKYNFESTDFYIAIYGNDETHEIIDKFKKVTVSNFDDLLDPENKKHIYIDSDRTHDYWIMAFYEDDGIDENESDTQEESESKLIEKEPLLIIQICGPHSILTADKWLKYLGILVEQRDPIDGKTLEQIMLDYETLTVEEIKKVREMIEELEDEEKGDYYLQLQGKVPYHNQRDNSYSTIADAMCNLTSEAMALEYLGVSCPKDDKQFEDYLEDLRVEKKYDLRSNQISRQKLAEELGVCHSQFNKDWTIGELISKDEFLTVLAPKLKEGCSMIIGGFMTDPGHIVRLQSITKDGIYVDDPFGKLTFNKDCTKSVYKPANSKESENEKCPGNNQFWNWCQVKTLKFFVVDIYYICEEE